MKKTLKTKILIGALSLTAAVAITTPLVSASCEKKDNQDPKPTPTPTPEKPTPTPDKPTPAPDNNKEDEKKIAANKLAISEAKKAVEKVTKYQLARAKVLGADDATLNAKKAEVAGPLSNANETASYDSTKLVSATEDLNLGYDNTLVADKPLVTKKISTVVTDFQTKKTQLTNYKAQHEGKLTEEDAKLIDAEIQTYEDSAKSLSSLLENQTFTADVLNVVADKLNVKSAFIFIDENPSDVIEGEQSLESTVGINFGDVISKLIKIKESHELQVNALALNLNSYIFNDKSDFNDFHTLANDGPIDIDTNNSKIITSKYNYLLISPNKTAYDEKMPLTLDRKNNIILKFSVKVSAKDSDQSFIANKTWTVNLGQLSNLKDSVANLSNSLAFNTTNPEDFKVPITTKLELKFDEESKKIVSTSLDPVREFGLSNLNEINPNLKIVNVATSSDFIQNWRQENEYLPVITDEKGNYGIKYKVAYVVKVEPANENSASYVILSNDVYQLSSEVKDPNAELGLSKEELNSYLDKVNEKINITDKDKFHWASAGTLWKVSYDPINNTLKSPDAAISEPIEGLNDAPKNVSLVNIDTLDKSYTKSELDRIYTLNVYSGDNYNSVLVRFKVAQIIKRGDQYIVNVSVKEGSQLFKTNSSTL